MLWEEIFKREKKAGLFNVKNKLKKSKVFKNFITFNIVGTNGKGSLAQYLTDSFISSGKKVGTFTSPHIFDPSERIKINNVSISNNDFERLAKDLNDFSFFETMYIVAIRYFFENKIDLAIIEAGIGGLKDTTKVLKSDYAVVTSIAHDHEVILGKTLEKIAIQKDGIRNDKTLMFVPDSIPMRVRKIFLHDNFLEIKNKSNNYKMENIDLAKGILNYFGIKLVQNQVFGRTTIIQKKDSKAIIDVAHNMAGIKASLKYIKSLKIEIKKIILSLKNTKKINNIRKIFSKEKVYIFKLSDDYYSGKELGYPEIKSIKDEYNKQSNNTLYIGTFRTLENFYEKSNKE